MNVENCKKCEFFIDYCQNINTINCDKFISFCVIKTGRSMRLFDKQNMLGYSIIEDLRSSLYHNTNSNLIYIDDFTHAGIFDLLDFKNSENHEWYGHVASKTILDRDKHGILIFGTRTVGCALNVLKFLQKYYENSNFFSMENMREISVVEDVLIITIDYETG